MVSATVSARGVGLKTPRGEGGGGETETRVFRARGELLERRPAEAAGDVVGCGAFGNGCWLCGCVGEPSGLG